MVTHGGILLLGLPHVLTNVDFTKARSLPIDNTIIIEAILTEQRLVCLSWGDQVLA